MAAFQPTFLTNSPDEATTVGATIRRYLNEQIEAVKNPPSMLIATAYFNPGGFQALKEPLKQMETVRLLLGAEPDDSPKPKPLAGRSSSRRRVSDRMKEAAQHHEQQLLTDRDMLGFSITADKTARELVNWLRGETSEASATPEEQGLVEGTATQVEVRRLTREFLHGKAYLMESAAGNAVFSGSSNFTFSGLHRNRELNLGQYDPATCKDVRAWFDQMWEMAEPYDLAAIYESRWEPHSPQLVFHRMLWEKYIDEVLQEQEDRNGSELKLLRFQSDGVWRARRILNKLHGVIIADEVGLGKTFLAGELIHDAMIKRRQKVLIVCPATLRDSTWRPFLQQMNLNTTVISYEELVNEVENPGQTGSKLEALDNYAMVVVDEAHALRNANSRRAEAMRVLTRGKVPKDLVLLTATPVNNSLQDVQNLLSYFITNDAQFADTGVASLREYFKRAMALHPDDLSPEHLFDVLDQVAVRRTRKFVRNHYAEEKIVINGKESRIRFPEPKVKRVDYDFDKIAPGFFDTVATALGATLNDDIEGTGLVDDDSGQVLTMARYVPSNFLNANSEEENSNQFERQNAGLLRSALLKRFESSAYAYEKTLETLIKSHIDFLDALNRGFVLTGQDLRDWGSSDSDDLVESLQLQDKENSSQYDVKSLRKYCEQDLALLQALRDQVRALDEDADPKIDQLVEELVAIAEEAEAEGGTEELRRDKRKVLIFTYFADTAEHIISKLEERLESDERLSIFRDRMTSVTGNDADVKAERIANFAPKTAGTENDQDLYDIVVATDVLSEGVNLQQARHIINYDLPWNPMRLVQRHGRIDRIGSPHETVFMRCFFPDAHLDQMLGLETRLQNKIKTAAASFGVSGAVLPGTIGRDGSFTETRDEIEKLRSGDASIFGTGGGAAQSGEDYRRQLEKQLSDPDAKKLIQALPWGSGSGFTTTGGDAGVVFCLRIADHGEPWFRFVPLHPGNLTPRIEFSDEGVEKPVVVGDTLSCISAADPSESSRVLDGDMQEAVYRAWDIVRADVVEKWNFNSDPNNTRPNIPPRMRQAADFIQQYGGCLGESQATFADRLRAPHDSRIQKATRLVLDDDSLSTELKVQELANIVEKNNLTAVPAAKPQPKITEEDVYVVCWQVFRPED